MTAVNTWLADNIRIVYLFAALMLALSTPASNTVAQTAASQPIVRVEIKGAIGVGTAYHLNEAFATAREQDAQLIVIRIDTPGGLVSATRDIIKVILGSPIPIAVYVAPSGARAASAGTYITYAAHIAAMTPGTHLGAATPIEIGAPDLPGRPGPSPGDPSKPSDDEKDNASHKKSVNDAVSYLKSLAQLRGRNAMWAEKAVREAATLTSSEALKENVVDLVANDLADLLRQLDERDVQMASGPKRLQLRNAVVVVHEPSWKVQLLNVLTDPNIAFVLLLIGIYGIIFEFWSPGLTGPGIIGAISLIVAMMALSLLPLNAAGIALLLLGLVLMVGEALAPGIGILGIGGVIAFMLGSLLLFDPAGADIDFSVAWPVALSATLTSALLIMGLLGFIFQARRRKVRTGEEELIGLEGRVVSWKTEEGRIRIHGEIWSARSSHQLKPGQAVSVDQRQGLTLVVSPIKERT